MTHFLSLKVKDVFQERQLKPSTDFSDTIYILGSLHHGGGISTARQKWVSDPSLSADRAAVFFVKIKMGNFVLHTILVCRRGPHFQTQTILDWKISIEILGCMSEDFLTYYFRGSIPRWRNEESGRKTANWAIWHLHCTSHRPNKSDPHEFAKLILSPFPRWKKSLQCHLVIMF